MHELANTADGRHAMAWTGETPWHGLGQKLDENATMEQWLEASGLDIELKTSPVLTEIDGKQVPVDDKQVIYRADIGLPLSVMGAGYKLVQPAEMLQFFEDYMKGVGQIETAGLLRDGRSYWAMARLEGELNIDGDITRPYVLLNSSCDGSSGTQGRFTSVRVVCSNTLSMATGSKPDVSISHRSMFDGQVVFSQFEKANEMFAAQGEMLRTLAKIKITDDKAEKLLRRVVDGHDDDERKLSKNSQRMLELFAGEGLGSQDTVAQHSAYGLLNAATQFFDWEYGREQDSRLEAAWFGHNAKNKANIAKKLVELAAV
jgi:phage/plasmid-like protein (TIGR03299 family)